MSNARRQAERQLRGDRACCQILAACSESPEGCACRAAHQLALQRLVEEDLYFSLLYQNLQRDDGFAVSIPVYLDWLSPMALALMGRLARAQILRNLHGQVRRPVLVHQHVLCACVSMPTDLQVQYQLAVASMKTEAARTGAHAQPNTCTLRTHATSDAGPRATLMGVREAAHAADV